MNSMIKNIQRIGFFTLALLASSGSLLAQSTDYTMPARQGSPIFGVIPLIIIVIVIASLWKVFTKAGQPGWACIIPIYNLYILCKIVGKSGWWVLLMFIPVVNFVIAIILAVCLAKCFGKGVGFAVGLIFLPFVFYPILGFGDATYQAAAA